MSLSLFNTRHQSASQLCLSPSELGLFRAFDCIFFMSIISVSLSPNCLIYPFVSIILPFIYSCYKFVNFIFYVHGRFACMFVCHMCALYTWKPDWHWTCWSYGWLFVNMQGLENETGSSGRRASTLLTAEHLCSSCTVIYLGMFSIPFSIKLFFCTGDS